MPDQIRSVIEPGVLYSPAQKAQDRNVQTKDSLYSLMQKIAEYKDYQDSEPQRRSLRERDIMTTEDYKRTRDTTVAAANRENERTVSIADKSDAYQAMQTVDGPQSYALWYKKNKNVAHAYDLTSTYNKADFKRTRDALKNSVEHMREMDLARQRGSGSGSYSLSDLKRDAILKYRWAVQQRVDPRTVLTPDEMALVYSGTGATNPYNAQRNAESTNLDAALGAMADPSYQTQGQLPGIAGGYNSYPYGAGAYNDPNQPRRYNYDGKSGWRIGNKFYPDED